ncbi:MAG TPA: hypothetical protein VE954_06680 [Oligoflexus sp.]|uniref:hypothetical protein n=1 Tax=Oligoflexus sp. TaxID=1971216 RepID=UPI002D6B1833|nr:hypothetical protein [Oligoflexus sp.]HYX32782.1 hypothetical protein [Oligoflexus sp.]
MIKMTFTGTYEDALLTDPSTVVDKAMRRSIQRSLDSTRSMAARAIARETKIRVRAIERGIQVKRPYGPASKGFEGEIRARQGESTPLSGTPHRIGYIVKQAGSQTKRLGFRRYQQIRLKFYGKSSFQLIPGAFRAIFRSNGGKHIALAMRRSRRGRRLPLREMFTQYPDVALWLIEHSREVSDHAQARLMAEFQTNLEFHRKAAARKATKQ